MVILFNIWSLLILHLNCQDSICEDCTFHNKAPTTLTSVNVWNIGNFWQEYFEEWSHHDIFYTSAKVTV